MRNLLFWVFFELERWNCIPFALKADIGKVNLATTKLLEVLCIFFQVFRLISSEISWLNFWHFSIIAIDGNSNSLFNSIIGLSKRILSHDRIFNHNALRNSRNSTSLIYMRNNGSSILTQSWNLEGPILFRNPVLPVRVLGMLH